MIQIYSAEDFFAAQKQKKKMLRIFFISLAAVIAINVGVFIFYVFQEFNTPLYGPLIAFNISFSAIYAVIAYIVMSIKYKRVKCYAALMDYIRRGLKTEGINTFVRIDSSITVKDGVDFVSLVVLQWSEKKQEYFERHILFDVEKPLPVLKKGDVIKHVTHGNVLIAYELCSPGIFE